MRLLQNSGTVVADKYFWQTKASVSVNSFQKTSLKTRLTLVTLAVFLIGIWSVAFYASRMLREDMQHQLGEHQFAAISVVGTQINSDLDERLKALERIASEISPALLGNADNLQTFLENRPLLQLLFNAGIHATGLDGIAVAAVPSAGGRIGTSYADRASAKY